MKDLLNIPLIEDVEFEGDEDAKDEESEDTMTDDDSIDLSEDDTSEDIEDPPELEGESDITNEDEDEPLSSDIISDNDTPSEEDISKPADDSPSLPKQVDDSEDDKNGKRRKKLYVAFIEWCKGFNSKNTFGSVFDKDAFHDNYTYMPHELRYFYRLANPMLCVLSGKLTFFALAEIKKLNSINKQFPDILIFAATDTDYRVFNSKDKKVYRATDENGNINVGDELSPTFDLYIQNMINQGNILNGPIEESYHVYNRKECLYD